MSASNNSSKAPLDETCFHHFAPLLSASQAYASFSGCRFRATSFDGLPDAQASDASVPAEVPPRRAMDPGPRLAAKLRAAPRVAEFRQRLLAGDRAEPALHEEVDRAFRIVMVESVRNAMIGMFQALEMFPPSPPPAGIADEDCAYEDVTAKLPEVAQRLYNDQARRLGDCDSDGFAGRLERRAMTAAFIVDFAEGVGVKMPAVPETQSSMLKELSARVAEETQRRGVEGESQERVREAFLQGLGAGVVAEKLRGEVNRWWAENWKTVAFAAAGAAVFGVVGAVAAVVLSKQRASPPRRQEPRDET